MKKQINKKFLALVGVFLLFPPVLSWAQQAEDEVDDTYGYDYIVNQLSENTVKAPAYEPDPFESVRFHFGVGFTNELLQVEKSHGSTTAYMNGIDISLGINLFTPEWIAEGSIKNYNHANSGSSEFQLREFELKTIYQSKLTKSWSYRFGGGLTARFLSSDYETGRNESYSTPSILILGGFVRDLSKNFSFHTDIGYKNALVSDSIDKNALDLTLRVNAEF